MILVLITPASPMLDAGAITESRCYIIYWKLSAWTEPARWIPFHLLKVLCFPQMKYFQLYTCNSIHTCIIFIILTMYMYLFSNTDCEFFSSLRLESCLVHCCTQRPLAALGISQANRSRKNWNREKDKLCWFEDFNWPCFKNKPICAQEVKAGITEEMC